MGSKELDTIETLTLYAKHVWEKHWKMGTLICTQTNWDPDTSREDWNFMRELMEECKRDLKERKSWQWRTGKMGQADLMDWKIPGRNENRLLLFSCLLLCSCSMVDDSLRPHGLQHTGPPCPSLSPRACSNSCALSQWCHPTISSSVIPFSSCL